MNSSNIVLDHEIASVLRVVEQRTIAFLRDELGLVADGVDCRLHQDKCVTLRALTAIVAVGSRAGLYIAYSYDELLIRAVTERFAAGLSILPEEELLYIRETASEVVNIIVGNCTTDLARRGELVTLSPPMLLLGARTIHGRPQAAIALLTLRFPEGTLDVAFVGPKFLFDDHLNYVGGSS
jgi:CheY-specific phosphatase CheX